jgi:hypothetical protein
VSRTYTPPDVAHCCKCGKELPNVPGVLADVAPFECSECDPMAKEYLIAHEGQLRCSGFLGHRHWAPVEAFDINPRIGMPYSDCRACRAERKASRIAGRGATAVIYRSNSPLSMQAAPREKNLEG